MMTANDSLVMSHGNEKVQGDSIIKEKAKN